MSEQVSEKTEKTEKAPFRIHQLVTKPAGMSLRFANRLRLIGQEMVAAPFRCVGHAAGDFVDECKTLITVDPTAAVVMGLPLGSVLAVFGFTPFVVAGALGVRLAKSAETMLGGIAMGTLGFIAGSVLSLWVIELAVLWLLIEAMLVVAKAAARVEARRLAKVDVAAAA